MLAPDISNFIQKRAGKFWGAHITVLLFPKNSTRSHRVRTQSKDTVPS